MVNRVVPRTSLAEVTFGLADQIATMPPFGLALAKRAVNQCEDLMGMRPGMDSVFGLHHLAHAHNAETSGDSLAGLDAHGMKDGAAKQEAARMTGGWAPGSGPGGRANAAFRAEVRDWLRAHVPARPLPSVDTAEGFAAHREWEHELAARAAVGGFLALRLRRPGRAAA